MIASTAHLRIVGDLPLHRTRLQICVWLYGTR